MAFYRSTPEQIEEFKEHLDEGMKLLEAYSTWIESDQVFARSLLSYYNKYDTLTDKQLYRATGFFHEALKNAGEEWSGFSSGTKPVVVHSEPVSEPVDVPRVVVSQEAGAKLIAMFDKVSEENKYPAVRIPLEEPLHGQHILNYYRTGQRSKQPYCINVTNGKKDSDWILFGQIIRDGTLVWGSYVFGKPDLQQQIKRVTDNFIMATATAGRRQGWCCFCCRTLTHSNSLHHGYGPICADKYGLPWEGVRDEDELSVTVGDL